jgi:hypothetical protein
MLDDCSSEAFEKLRNYVRENLLKSRVIPKNPESIAAHIVADAWRQCDTYYFADFYIQEAIKFPPEPITNKRFSLKAFVEIRR